MNAGILHCVCVSRCVSLFVGFSLFPACNTITTIAMREMAFESRISSIRRLVRVVSIRSWTWIPRHFSHTAVISEKHSELCELFTEKFSVGSSESEEASESSGALQPIVYRSGLPLKGWSAFWTPCKRKTNGLFDGETIQRVPANTNGYYRTGIQGTIEQTVW